MGGDVFYNKHYQTLKYNEQFIFMFDYKENNIENSHGLLIGFSGLGHNPGRHTWRIISGNSDQDIF